VTSASDDEALDCHGFCTITGQGQITIPAAARRAIGLEENSRVVIFADTERRVLIVGHEPPAQEVLDAVVRAGKARAT
jgi:AbrB family looped-hinge helix DNA binding protein